MLRTPVALIGLGGVAFLAGGFVPGSFNVASLSQPQEFLQQILMRPTEVPAKGDRMAAPFPTSRRTVSIVELVGISNATIILRGRDGEILYRSNPRTGVTTFSKNVDLPLITLKEETHSPGEQHPVSVKEGSETPQPEAQRPRRPVGCMGDVSPLAKASADRMPSLCLASADPMLF